MNSPSPDVVWLLRPDCLVESLGEAVHPCCRGGLRAITAIFGADPQAGGRARFFDYVNHVAQMPIERPAGDWE